MSIASELTRLSGIVTDLNTISESIRGAIIAKGGTSPQGHTFKDFTADIASIPYTPSSKYFLIENGAKKVQWTPIMKQWHSGVASGSTAALPTETANVGYLTVMEPARASTYRAGAYYADITALLATGDYTHLKAEVRRSALTANAYVGFCTNSNIATGAVDGVNTVLDYDLINGLDLQGSADASNVVLDIALTSASTSAAACYAYFGLKNYTNNPGSSVDIYNVWLE